MTKAKPKKRSHANNKRRLIAPERAWAVADQFSDQLPGKDEVTALAIAIAKAMQAAVDQALRRDDRRDGAAGLTAMERAASVVAIIRCVPKSNPYPVRLELTKKWYPEDIRLVQGAIQAAIRDDRRDRK